MVWWLGWKCIEKERMNRGWKEKGFFGIWIFCDVDLFDGNNHELLLINEWNLYYYKRKQNVDQRKEIIENIFVSISIIAFKNRNIDVIMSYLNDSNK